MGVLSMWNFNSTGVSVIRERLQLGMGFEVIWVWPWRRKAVSQGSPYLAQVSNWRGLVLESYSDKDLSSAKERVLSDTYELTTLKPILDQGVTGFTFDMVSCVEGYLEGILQDGVYLVYVPSSEAVRSRFWKSTLGDGYVIEVNGRSTSELNELCKTASKAYPGRYVLVIVNNGHVIRLRTYS